MTTKKCAVCAEEVPVDARICKSCSSDLTGTLIGGGPVAPSRVPGQPVRCSVCEVEVKPGKKVCQNCGTRVDVFEDPGPGGSRASGAGRGNQKSWVAAILLCALGLVGVAGLHRFYVGKTASGLAMLFTLGGLGLWTAWDLYFIQDGAFEDAEGYPLREHR